MSKKIPATTIVLECSSADTGVGPSIADGNHGCKPNCADLPVAAIINPMAGTVVLKFLRLEKISLSSQELIFTIIHAIVRMSPISPARLYRIAWRAAVLASGRAYHQLMRRNDMIPTPSQPTNSWNILLAVTKVIIEIRKISRYLKN